MERISLKIFSHHYIIVLFLLVSCWNEVNKCGSIRVAAGYRACTSSPGPSMACMLFYT